MGKALILTACLLLAGCPASTTYVSDFCLQASPARPNGAAWDAADRQFREWIVAHNEKGAALCGWKP